MSTSELIAAVKKHATKNYEQGGWDIVVECYSDKELTELIGDATTEEEAIKRVGEDVGIHASVRSDVWGHGGLCTKCGAVEGCEHRNSDGTTRI